MSRFFQIKHTKKGMKTLIRKIIWMQAYYSAIGLHRQEGRLWIPSGNGKKRIKLATLAYVLEQGASWIQGKTVILTNYKGERTAIKAGSRIKIPSRTFIRINKIPDLWDKLRAYYRELIFKHLNAKDRNYKQGAKKIFDEIGSFVKILQKNIISQGNTAENRLITEWYKGFNHPLKNTGKLGESIRNKTLSSAKGKAQRDEQRLRYLTDIDNMIKQLNGK